jgi:hypothetical protein
LSPVQSRLMFLSHDPKVPEAFLTSNQFLV